MNDRPSSGSAEPVRLALGSDLTIYHAAEHRDALLQALTSSDRLELDLSAVADIDTAGLQLLILLKREAATLGRQLTISNHSAAVRQAIDFCNLAAAFGDPIVIPA